MADVIGLTDVSSEDIGKGSELKTGGVSRKYNTNVCKEGQVFSVRLKRSIQKSNNSLWSNMKGNK